MSDFEHERLDVYRASIEFLVLADEIAADLPKGRAYLADQLRRAATSVSLNIAEGAGEFAGPDKARFYRMALRLATECAAVLDVCASLGLVEVDRARPGRALLQRMVAMLTALAVRMQEPGTGAGTGAGTGTVR
jgi:four helix bundle protein